MIYFPEPYTRGKNKIKDELDFSKYRTKSDLKNAPGVDISDFPKKADIASLKSYIDKLETTPTELSKLSKVVEKD